MKVAIVAQPTEIEADLQKAGRQSGDEVRIYSVSEEQGGHGRSLPDDKVGLSGFIGWAILDLLDRARAWHPDLLIIRFPFWLTDTGILDEARELLRHERVVIYQSEQGPTREWAIARSKGWRHVAVNCRADEVVYRLRLPGAVIHYLPFGCVALGPEDLVYTPRYDSDIVSDGWAHYKCECYGGWKRESVHVMIRPLIERGMDLALYGRCDKDALPHSWLAVPGAIPSFRGEYPQAAYPKVYASAKVYVGATWNWAHGGYGIRLVKVLSTGIPTVWQHTLWADRDGLRDGEQLMFSSSPGETVEKARYLLEHPDEAKALGQRGKAWVRANWDWMTNLRRVAEGIA